jgi:hypothetical protein
LNEGRLHLYCTGMGRSYFEEKAYFRCKKFDNFYKYSFIMGTGVLLEFLSSSLFFVPHRSIWFERVNFDVTQFTSYYNDRSKNFTHKECENHFYPSQSRPSYEVDTATTLGMFNFSGLFSICVLMVATVTRQRWCRFIS